MMYLKCHLHEETYVSFVGRPAGTTVATYVAVEQRSTSIDKS
jgi:hypothetical protein